MSLPLCPLQYACPDYQANRKVKDNHVRETVPCKLFLKMTCQVAIDAEQKITGKPIACDINKGKENK